MVTARNTIEGQAMFIPTGHGTIHVQTCTADNWAVSRQTGSHPGPNAAELRVRHITPGVLESQPHALDGRIVRGASIDEATDRADQALLEAGVVKVYVPWWRLVRDGLEGRTAFMVVESPAASRAAYYALPA